MNSRFYDVILTASNAISPFPRLERNARYLASAGLYCLAVGWDRNRKYSPFERREFDIVRVRFPGNYGSGMRNLYGLLRLNLWFLYLHLKLRPKAIHAYDLDTVLPALLVKPFIKCKVIYDIADWYADSRKVGFLRPLIEKIERWACRKADLVILAHEKRLEQVGFTPKRWLVLYNAPEDLYNKLRTEDVDTMHDGYFAYVGVLHPDRGLDCLVRATTNIGARLVLAGFGPLEPYCRDAASKYTNVQFLGQIPYEQTLAVESGALAIVALYDPTLRNNRLAAPNKLYEAMMLGRPLITTRGTLAGELVEKEGIGIAVPYGNAHELGKAMEYLRENPKERAEMGQRARKLYEQEYSPVRQREKLLKAYREINPEMFTSSSEA